MRDRSRLPEWVREKLKVGYRRIALIGPTAADCRDVMVEGVSGIMSVCWEQDRTDTGEVLGRPIYEPSKRRLTWANGAQCQSAWNLDVNSLPIATPFSLPIATP